MTDDLASLDATGTAALIRRGDATALEVVDAAITRAEAAQTELNFLTTDLFDAARARAAGPIDGPFAGVPYLVKDMFDVAGAPTKWGARFGPFMPPAAANAPQVDAMEAAGLVVIGKSALGEMGFLPTTEPLVSGPTRNPWNREMSTGGSSGGSAAAVAAGVVPMADAADGGGSIRIPASACGLFGLKPSRGALVGEQNAAAGYPLTTEHCVSRTVRDSAGLFAAMAATPGAPVEGPSAARLRVGLVLSSLSGLAPDPSVAAAVEATGLLLEKLGHRVEPAGWTFDTTSLLGDFSILYASAALEVVGLVRGILGSEPDETVLEPFTLGMASFAAALAPGDLDRAKETLAAVPYDSAFARYDVILSPVLLTPSVPLGHITGDVPFDLCLARLAAFADYTILHNITGAPAMSVPLGLSPDGIPIGSQFSGPVGSERMLFELAYELEEAQPFTRLPSSSS